ncbi:MAG: hypothetical protein ACLFM0_07660 [Spirochaetales bacterium]
MTVFGPGSDEKRKAAASPCIIAALWVVLSLVALVTASPLYAQTRSPHFDNPGEIVLPENYEEDGEHPLLVLLPYTGGTAEEQARAFGIEPGEQEDVVLLLPEGSFVSSDYLPDFLSFVEWFEERLYKDISEAAETYSIDTGRIYLAGYSLGGDMSWALSVRNPEDFSGALVAGSRSSHPVPDQAVDVLADEGFRAAFLIGDSDTQNRYEGIQYAHSLLEEGNVDTFYSEYDGGHELPPQDLSIDALEFISDHESGRISASGTDWPSSPGTTSTALGDGFFSLFRERSEPTGRVRIETDIPVGISRVYDTGVGFAGDGRHAIVAESLHDSWWLYGDFTLKSDHTSIGTYNRRLSSTLGLAYGDGLRLGGVAGWDYARWLSASGGIDTGASLGSGTVYRRYYVGATAQFTGGRQHTPRAGLTLKYRTPSYIAPFSLVHLADMELEAYAWPVNWLRLQSRFSSGTIQHSPAAERDDQHKRSESALSWELGGGLSISEDILLSLSYRGQLLSVHSDESVVTREGYNDQWRLGLRYALY